MADSLRVLVAGWLNSPHVVAWAGAVRAAGHDVHVVGRIAPQLPDVDRPPAAHVLSASWPPPLRGLRMSAELGRVASSLEPDLVHAHWLPEYGWMAAREGLAPLVCSAWGSDVLLPTGRIARRRSQLALGAATLVCADSAHLAGATRELAPGEVRVEVVRWGLDLARFSPGDVGAARTALGLPAQGPLIASLRSLDPIYNPGLVLEAFALMRARHPDARLLLKHPENHLPTSIAQAMRRLGIDDGVTVLGHVPAEQYPDVLRAADVVVSIPSSDSSPRSVWEALACGRPVVVSDLPWAREELNDGEQAVLTPLDPESVAGAIDSVLTDPGLARRLGAGGRALATAELDPARCTARIDELYRSVTEAAR